MYLPWLFSERNEYQRFGGLIADRGAEPETEEFLFRASSVRLAQNRITELKAIAERKLRRHRAQLKLDTDAVEFWCDEVVDLVGRVSFGLTQLRIMQNLLIAILARIQGLKNLPGSMSDLIKEGPEGYGFTAEVSAALKSYWSEGGRTVKDYRDVDDHFFAIARHAAMHLTPTEALKVYLPDEAGQKSRRKATFTGKVEAVEFFRAAQVALERFADRCLDLLGVPSVPLALVTGLNPAMARVDKETTIAVGVPGSRGLTAFQMRFDPTVPRLHAEVVALPPNDPEDCPIPLPEVVQALRDGVKGGTVLMPADLKYVGGPEMMFSIMGLEFGGPWRVWIWRFECGGHNYFAIVHEDERCPWVAWQRIAAGRDPGDALAELCMRTIFKRDRAVPEPIPYP